MSKPTRSERGSRRARTSDPHPDHDIASTSEVDELRDRVHEYNFDTTGYRDGRSLSCFLRDAHGRLFAGIDGFTWGGYAKIEYLWVDSARRGEEIGRR
jgi:hypothetical protein